MVKNKDLVSVKFNVVNDKKYYAGHRWRYELKDQDAILEDIPHDEAEYMQFYFYEDSEWVLDAEAKNQYIAEKMQAEEDAKNENNSVISNEDLLGAILEIASSVSSLEEAVYGGN